MHTQCRGVGRAELLGGGGEVPSSLKFLPGMGLGRGVKLLTYIFFFFGGGGVPGNLETPLATPLQCFTEDSPEVNQSSIPKYPRYHSLLCVVS